MIDQIAVIGKIATTPLISWDWLNLGYSQKLQRYKILVGLIYCGYIPKSTVLDKYMHIQRLDSEEHNPQWSNDLSLC